MSSSLLITSHRTKYLGETTREEGGEKEREMEKERPKSLFTLREVAACFMVQKLFYIIL